MNFLKRFLPVILLFMTVFVGNSADAKASASNESISVIVPSTIEITFNEDGTTSTTEFNVLNQSSVLIELSSVYVTELNDWKLVIDDKEIGIDSKEISYRVDGTEILSGENKLSILIDSMELHNFDLDIKRGLWTYSSDCEEAFWLEFNYSIVENKNILTLDGNDYANDRKIAIDTGETVELPILSHAKYEFMGWADEHGKRYTDSFTMPDKSTFLIAMWDVPAYALFTESDGRLTFVQSEEEIYVGQTHHGEEITNVYSEFDEANDYDYDSYVAPWIEDGISRKVSRVVFEDFVFPEITDGWFAEFENCMTFDVRRLQVFQSYTMSYMFYGAGRYGNDSDFTIIGMDYWDTSQVTRMEGMFELSGQYAKSYNIGNIGAWDISNVDALVRLFRCAGEYSKSVYIGDLSQWDVSFVYDYTKTFQYMAANATDFYIGDLSNWDTNNAWLMEKMFDGAGENSQTFYLGDISRWETAGVFVMDYMFRNTGRVARWSIDLSGWNVYNASHYEGFNDGVSNYVIAPIWEN